MLVSDDGLAWQLVETGIPHDLRGVAAGSAGFVAVGDGGLTAASGDGRAWRATAHPAAARLNAVAWTGGRWVAVGAAAGSPLAGIILTSDDALHWQERTPPGIPPLYGVTGAGGRALAVGWTGAVAESADGLSWQAGSLGELLQQCWFMLRPSYLFAAAAGVRGWVAVGLVVGDQYPGAGVSLARPPGGEWSCTVTELPPLQFQFRAVTATPPGFLAAGRGGIAVSADGRSWQPEWVAPTPSLAGVAAGPHRWVAVGEGGSILGREAPVARTVRRVVRPAPHP